MAFSGQGAAGGALSGAYLGTQFFPGIGTVGGALIGGALGGFLGGGEETPQAGYDVVTMPQYSFTEPMLRQTSDYLSDSMSRLGRGEFPAYWDNALPKLKKQMSDSNYQTYYGTPGNRSGITQKAMEAGSITGVGPKASMSNVNKAQQDYANLEAQIDAYLTQQGVNIMSNEAQYLPNQMMNMPRGPNSQIVTYGGAQTQATNPWMSMAGQIPWESMISNNSGYTEMDVPYSPSFYNAPQIPGSGFSISGANGFV